MVFNYIKNFFHKLIYSERSAEKLALSFSVGVFIAFSPFIGFHNIMVFILSWFLRLNLITTFAIAHINNPLTMIPIFGSCYLFGKWMVNLTGLNINFVNPWWINYINENLHYYVGLPKMCFWTFFIGSNVLGLILALFLYPVTKFLFKKLISEKKQLA